MNIRDIQNGKYRRIALAQNQPRTLSRRQFMRGAAGAAALSVALGSELWSPQVAEAGVPGNAQPIPGGTPVLGGAFRVFGPAAIDPVDAEPSTINNFNGFVGLTYISGMVTRTNIVTQEVRRLPFVESDMRFMKGHFKGTDGHVHAGAFALIWVDVYEPGPGAQIDDLNPTSFPPLPPKLFWTVPIHPDTIQVDLSSGAASMEAKNVHVIDYGNIGNALFGGGTKPIPAMVSYKVRWNGVGQRVQINNHDPVYGGFGGEFVRNSAQMEWTAMVHNYRFVSDPLSTSSSSFAEIGHERNGSFFS